VSANVDASAGVSSGGAAELSPEDVGVRVERHEKWYAGIVHRAFRRGLRKWTARRAELRNAVDAVGARAHAIDAIRRASLKSAAAGAVTGTVTTGAAVLTAETEGMGAFVALPVTAGAIAGEMFFRAVVHVDLACELAETYGVPFDPCDEDDLWRLHALVFGALGAPPEDDRGKGALERLMKVGREQLADTLGRTLLGHAILLDVVPFIAVVTSSVGNYTATRRLGHTIRRFMRYERAIRDAIDRARISCVAWPACMDLLVEGLWFVFTADGALTPEEAALLAHMLRGMDPAARRALTARFVEDERDWIERIAACVPPDSRGAFLYALEVAAALDKKIVVPERKLLLRVAESFGRSWDPGTVERLIGELAGTGVAKQ
jgi:hypothetical protein